MKEAPMHIIEEPRHHQIEYDHEGEVGEERAREGELKLQEIENEVQNQNERKERGEVDGVQDFKNWKCSLRT